jgi:hypothetical protein
MSAPHGLLAAAVRQLLAEAPVHVDEAAEATAAFEALCGRIRAGRVEVEHDYYLRLVDVAGALGVPEAVQGLWRDDRSCHTTPGEPPRELDGAAVLRYALVGDEQRPTGKTVHSVTNFADVVRGLALARYEEGEVYLFYCDEEWTVVSDTCHATEEDAIGQARFEFDDLDFQRPA